MGSICYEINNNRKITGSEKMRSSSYTVHLMKDYKEELTNELAEFEKKGA